LQGEVLVVHRAPNGVEIIGDRLKPTGVGHDGHISAGGGAKSFAEVEVPGGLIVEEESMESSPGGARQTIGGVYEAVQIVTEGCHEPKADVDVDSTPAIIGIARDRALGDMVQDLVHGEQKLEDLAPLREICPGGIDQELDVVVDMNVQNWMGVGGWCGLGGKERAVGAVVVGITGR
jgi:hypothetical protein